jgi:hypothetical protein
MCDQDHFEDDRQKYEALGLVTRADSLVSFSAPVSR